MSRNETEPTIFTRIIRGEIPGRFVWRDPDVVAFLTIAPIRPGHVLVVPTQQVDQWTDLDADTWAKLSAVSHIIGAELAPLFDCVRIGMIIAGLEVPHCHVHLIPIRSESELSFSLADPNPDPEEMDEIAERIRTALTAAGLEHGAG